MRCAAIARQKLDQQLLLTAMPTGHACQYDDEVDSEDEDEGEEELDSDESDGKDFDEVRARRMCSPFHTTKQ